jgi:hypothetical protein
MKIAISLSGLPRQYKAGYEELKKWFLDRYDCDVYIHTWYDTQSVFHTGHKFAPNVSYKFTEENYNELLELYKPKNYTFQKPIPFDANGLTSKLGVKLNVSLSTFYSLQHSFNLIKESGIHYDYIIRTRFDLRFTDYISSECTFLKDISLLNPNQLNHFQYSDDPSVRVAEIDDLFAIGSLEVMDVYCNTFSYILNYLYMNEEYKEWLNNLIPDPEHLVNESLLKFHLLKNNTTLNPVSSLTEYFTAHIMR